MTADDPGQALARLLKDAAAVNKLFVKICGITRAAGCRAGGGPRRERARVRVLAGQPALRHARRRRKAIAANVPRERDEGRRVRGSSRSKTSRASWTRSGSMSRSCTGTRARVLPAVDAHCAESGEPDADQGDRPAGQRLGRRSTSSIPTSCCSSTRTIRRDTAERARPSTGTRRARSRRRGARFSPAD